MLHPFYPSSPPPAVDPASVKSLQFAAWQAVVSDYTAREEQRLSLVTLDISPGGAAILFANPGIDLYSAPTYCYDTKIILARIQILENSICDRPSAVIPPGRLLLDVL